MTNTSILAAFERFWQHVVALVGTKSDVNHTHDDKYYTETEVDTKLSSKASSTHTHGNITNAGAIGTAADKAVITTINGVLTTGTVPVTSGGTGATTAAAALVNLGLTATAAELNKMDGVTATTAELNYVDGVTSNIQTQLNAKQATINGGASTITSSNLTASRALVSDTSGKVAVSAVTSTELGYLDGVTSAIQTQLDGKQATVTGGASTITGSNLTTNRALVSNGSGKVAVSDVTSTELGYLDGVTSNIQTQLNAKAAQSSLTSHTDNTTVHITAAERTAWNAKSNFSGNYNDLTNKPTIPSIAGLASTSYVDTAISNAIGNAIAASY